MQLKEAGFEELDETDPSITVVIGGKYYYTRNKSSIVAFTVGEAYRPGYGGFKIIGAHTDSPNLKIKPRSKRSLKTSKSIQVGVECYGKKDEIIIKLSSVLNKRRIKENQLIAYLHGVRILKPSILYTCSLGTPIQVVVYGTLGSTVIFHYLEGYFVAVILIMMTMVQNSSNNVLLR